MIPCPICGNSRHKTVFQLPRIPPFTNVLAPSRAQARETEMGEQHLVCCCHCGFVFNQAFKLEKVQYGREYHAERGNSPVFDRHTQWIIQSLEQYVHPEQGVILEVGCGTGEFLRACQQKLQKKLSYIGVDPSAPVTSDDSISYCTTLFDQNFVQNHPMPVQLIIHRHMIEHVVNPLEQLKLCAETLSNGGLLYLETPRLDWILEHKTFFDFGYEHCSYFSDEFMRRMLKVAGFEILEWCPSYKGQYFSILAKKGSGGGRYISPIPQKALEQVQVQFQQVTNEYQRWKESFTVTTSTWIWGAACKGTMWVNLFDQDGVMPVVDINPYKQNKYILGTGNRVYAPETLLNDSDRMAELSAILVMNPIYLEEIQSFMMQHCPDKQIQYILANE